MAIAHNTARRPCRKILVATVATVSAVPVAVICYSLIVPRY